MLIKYHFLAEELLLSSSASSSSSSFSYESLFFSSSSSSSESVLSLYDCNMGDLNLPNISTKEYEYNIKNLNNLLPSFLYLPAILFNLENLLSSSDEDKCS